MKNLQNILINEAKFNKQIFNTVVAILIPLEEEGVIDINREPWDNSTEVGITIYEKNNTKDGNYETGKLWFDIENGLWQFEQDGPHTRYQDCGDTAEMFEFCRNYFK